MADFFESLVENYSKINFPENYSDLIKIGKPISWYESDFNDRFVSVDSTNSKIVEIDISGAFPNICRCLFGEDSPFVKDIYAADTKRSRNILIATTLKREKPGYLTKLNLICKLIILGVTFEISPFDTKLRPFASGDFITYQLPFEHNPRAKALRQQAYRV